MAAVNNVYSDLIPQLLAAGIVVLRETSVMPRLVSNYSDMVAAQRGSTIDIPLNPSLATRAVSADSLPADPPAMTHATTPLTLDQWREVPWVITDKEAAEISDGAIPRAMREAVIKLSQECDAYILNLYKGVFNVGLSMDFAMDTDVAPAFVVASTPNPSGLRAFREARAWLNREGAPAIGRRVVLGVDDESDALSLGQFLAADQRGDQGGIIEGQIGRKLGSDWYMDQAVKVHSAGTLSDAASQVVTVNGALSVGATSANFDGTITASLTINIGDLFKFNNHDQIYVATNAVTTTLNTITGLQFSPALRQAVPDNDTPVKFLKSHTANLLFYPDAIGFASRPLAGIGNGDYQSVTDPVSGLTLRVEVSRQNKRDYVSVDMLYGAKLVDARLAARIASAP